MTPQQFIDKYAPAAISAQIKYGIPASITLAQAALESAWGKSSLTREANNFFGIKDQANDEWYREYVVKDTAEVLNGQRVVVSAKFRKYADPADSFNDHASFLLKNSRYKALFLLSPLDYTSWAKGLQKAGYATATNYATTLINIINTYKLNKFDAQAELKKKSGSSL